MKLLLVLTLSIAALSCNKLIAEKPVIKSVTYQRLHYVNGVVVLVDTSIHWCNVSGEDLKRFEAMPKIDYLICDTSELMRMRLIIGDPCPFKDMHYSNGQIKGKGKLY